MVFKIRIVLDFEKDVIRTIALDATSTLEELHHTITNAFGFNGRQMASFYRTDQKWSQGEEIPLISMDDGPASNCMANTTLEQNLTAVGEKMIYVYDFLNMWTFFVELVGISEEKTTTLPKLILSLGDLPEKAPEKKFKSSESTFQNDDLDDDEDFGNFENIDDLDLDAY